MGERSKDPHIQHNSDKVATLDVQSDLQLESKLIDEINNPTGQPSFNLSNLTASLTIIQQNTLRIIRSDITALQKNLDNRRAEVEKSLEKLSLSISTVSKENAALKSRCPKVMLPWRKISRRNQTPTYRLMTERSQKFDPHQ